MVFAFLFDIKESYLNFTGVVEEILTTDTIKQENAIYIVRIGDLLFDSPSSQTNEIAKSAIHLFKNSGQSRIDEASAFKCLHESRIFCIVIEGLTSKDANDLDFTLMSDSLYIGYHEVDYSKKIYNTFYRELLGRKFRVYNRSLEIFYKMGNTDEIDSMWEDIFNPHFQQVSHVDDGAHGTIFDEFDSVEHFRRVNYYSNTLKESFDEREVNNIVTMIEDINPSLSDNIFSAMKSLSTYEAKEDLAQTSLSVRRYIEALADTVFPPRETREGERKLNQSSYRNRLWAFISESYSDKEKVQRLGEELDRLDKLANKGLHNEISKVEVRSLVNDVLRLTQGVTLEAVRQPTRKPSSVYE